MIQSRSLRSWACRRCGVVERAAAKRSAPVCLRLQAPRGRLLSDPAEGLARRFGIPDDEGGEAVKAVVVMKPGESATAQEIIDTAARHLASYQKPRSVDFVDSLPKAPTGKILKRQLRDPYWEAAGKKV